jgi:hypothetical protein
MNLRMAYRICFALLTVVVGCGSPATSTDDNVSVAELTARMDNKPEPAKPTPAATPQPAREEPASQSAELNTSAGEATTLSPDARPASERPQVQSRGYFGAISSANRNIRQRMDDVAWQKSVQLFEAEMGRKPRNTEEFLERVRREGTPLPEIPPGYRYVYVPEEGQFGELYAEAVEQPQGDSASADR